MMYTYMHISKLRGLYTVPMTKNRTKIICGITSLSTPVDEEDKTVGRDDNIQDREEKEEEEEEDGDYYYKNYNPPAYIDILEACENRENWINKYPINGINKYPIKLWDILSPWHYVCGDNNCDLHSSYSKNKRFSQIVKSLERDTRRKKVEKELIESCGIQSKPLFTKREDKLI